MSMQINLQVCHACHSSMDAPVTGGVLNAVKHLRCFVVEYSSDVVMTSGSAARRKVRKRRK